MTVRTTRYSHVHCDGADCIAFIALRNPYPLDEDVRLACAEFGWANLDEGHFCPDHTKEQS